MKFHIPRICRSSFLMGAGACVLLDCLGTALFGSNDTPARQLFIAAIIFPAVHFFIPQSQKEISQEKAS